MLTKGSEDIRRDILWRTNVIANLKWCWNALKYSALIDMHLNLSTGFIFLAGTVQFQLYLNITLICLKALQCQGLFGDIGLRISPPVIALLDHDEALPYISELRQEDMGWNGCQYQTQTQIRTSLDMYIVVHRMRDDCSLSSTLSRWKGT